jgi:hypothetical protein
LQLIGGDGAVAEHLHVRLGVPAHCVAVDDRGESSDHAVVEHAVHPPLDRRGGQVHPLPDLGERGPGVLGQFGQDALVDLVQTVHDHPYAINRRNPTLHARKSGYISNMRRLIA